MNEQSKHTAGPWKIIKVQNDFRNVAWGIVAVEPMRGRVDSEISGISESDARLMAAACSSYDRNCGDSAVEMAEADLLGEALATLKEASALFEHDHALSRFNWGSAFLRGQDIRELNELPLKIKSIIAKVEGH